MTFKNFSDQLNIVSQCRKYGVSLWQCPQFIFLIMGIVIIFSSLATYAIGNKYIDDPYQVSLIVIFFTLVLFVLAAILSKSLLMHVSLPLSYLKVYENRNQLNAAGEACR